MPSYTRGPVPGPSDTFGKNEYRRSTRNESFDHGTVAAASVATETWSGDATQKILQSGEVLAKITSGPDAGKYGPYQAGATDGRGDLANVVGINDTFLPWQLRERDVECAFLVHGRVVQGWCFERNAAGARIPLSNATAEALLNKKTLSILFA